MSGVACGKRVAKLYALGRYFLCRHCYRLAYDSQSEGAWLYADSVHRRGIARASGPQRPVA
jgi:hypothetical protein